MYNIRDGAELSIGRTYGCHPSPTTGAVGTAGRRAAASSGLFTTVTIHWQACTRAELER